MNTSSEDINRQRRRFLGAAAVTVAAIRCSSSLAGMTHATRERSELTRQG